MSRSTRLSAIYPFTDREDGGAERLIFFHMKSLLKRGGGNSAREGLKKRKEKALVN